MDTTELARRSTRRAVSARSIFAIGAFAAWIRQRGTQPTDDRSRFSALRDGTWRKLHKLSLDYSGKAARRGLCGE
jgi:hypothetical protein